MADQGEAVEGLGKQLWAACSKGDVEKATRLLCLGAPLEYRGEGNMTPLIAAVCNEHFELVIILADRGADIEARDGAGRRALLIAATEGHLQLVTFLTERGADIEAFCIFGYNSLMRAAMRGHLAVARYLADKGAEIGARKEGGNGLDALLLAALENYIDVALFLISRGGDPRVEDHLGHSAVTHFGRGVSASPEVRELGRRQILAAFKAGPHPDMRWLRRRSLILALVGSKLRPMARDIAAAKQEQEQADKTVPLDSIDRSTPAANWTYLLSEVFGHEGMVRLIAQFVPPGDEDEEEEEEEASQGES